MRNISQGRDETGGESGPRIESKVQGVGQRGRISSLGAGKG